VIGKTATSIHRFMRFGCAALVALITAGLTTPAAAEDGAQPQVIVHPLSVRYTPDFLAHKKHRKHQVTGRDLDRMRRHYQEVVTEKLAAGFVIASKPGPRVVRIDAVLVNHELDKGHWLVPTRIAFVGAPRVQLVAYVRNSETGEILDRVGLTLSPDPNRLMKASPGFYWHYMRRVFDRIGTRVRWALEDGAAPS
jgi:hypothetical protein